MHASDGGFVFICLFQGRHNLTLMFNAIETRDRLEEDAVEHGNDLPPEPEHIDEKISHE